MLIFQLNIFLVIIISLLQVKFIKCGSSVLSEIPLTYKRHKDNSKKSEKNHELFQGQSLNSPNSLKRILEEKDNPNSQTTRNGYKWIGGVTVQQVLDRTQGKGPSLEENVIYRNHIIHNSEKLFFDFNSAFIEHSEVNITVRKNWLKSKRLLENKLSESKLTSNSTQSSHGKLREDKPLPPSQEYVYEPFVIQESVMKLPTDMSQEDIKKYKISGANLTLSGLEWDAKMVYYDRNYNLKFIGEGILYTIDSVGQVVKVTEGSKPEYPKKTYEPKLRSRMRSTDSKNNCQKFFYLKDLRKSVFMCKDSENRWYILIKCSDGSCNDSKEILKISENRRDKTTTMSLKMMPGVIGSSALTIFTWFQGDVLLEEVSIDHSGQYTSRIHVLKNKLQKIRFFAGQLLVFEFLEKGTKSFYYKITDFGSKYDFDNLSIMKDMGTFVNSFNTKEESDLMIETFDKENNILCLKFDKYSQLFTIETTMENDFPSSFNPSELNERNFITYIFEMGDYKIMVSARKVLKDGNFDFEDIVYNIVYKGKVLKVKDEKKIFFFESKFSKVSGLDKLAAIDFKVDDITKTKLKVIQFHRPVLSIDGKFGLLSKSNSGRRVLQEYSTGKTGDFLSESKLFQDFGGRRLLEVDTTSDKVSSIEILGNEKDKKGKLKKVKYLKLETTFSDDKLGTTWLMPLVKYGPVVQNAENLKDPKNKENVAYISVKSQNLSDMVFKMHKVARGSFLAVLKFYPLYKPKDENPKKKITVFKKKEKPYFIDFTNKINPLFGFKKVNHVKTLKFSSSGKTYQDYTFGEQLIQTNKLINIINRGPETQLSIILAADKNNFNVSKFEVHNGKLFKVWEKNQLVEPQEVHIFNETMIIIKDRETLWSYDLIEDRKVDKLFESAKMKFIQNSKTGKHGKVNFPDGGRLREILFEKKKCIDFLLVRHQYIDVTFWCKEENNLNAYYAREVLSRKVGLSKLKLLLPKNINWSHLKLAYTNFFQDNFFGIDSDFNLHSFKIDAKMTIKLIKIHQVSLNIEKKKFDKILDVKFIEDKLVIYSASRLGWESQIVLNFFHLKDSITPVFLKKVVLDPSFSPDFSEPYLFRFQSVRTNMFKEKYIFMPMFALKVKHHQLYDNVVFINPALEYHQSIPSVLFPLESKVKLKVGISIDTGFDTWEQSLFAVYQNYTTNDQLKKFRGGEDWKTRKCEISGKDINVSIIIADQMKLRVFESSSTEITDIYKSKDANKAKMIILSQYNSTSKILRDKGIPIHIKYDKNVLNKQLIEFTQKTITLDLNKQDFKSSLINHKKLAYPIETFDRIKGNVFKFMIKPESALEAISGIIKLQSHVLYIGKRQNVSLSSKQKDQTLLDFSKLKQITTDSLSNNQIKKSTDQLSNPLVSITDSHEDDKRLLQDPYSVDNTQNSTCTKSCNLYMNSLIRNQTKYKFEAFFDSENFNAQKNGLYLEQYQVWVCKSTKARNYADLYVRGLWKNKTMHTQKFEQAIQNVFVNDYRQLELNFYDYILTLTAFAESSRRKIYVDMYYLDIFQQLNSTIEVEIDSEIITKFPIQENSKDPVQIKLNSNLRKTARRYQMFSSLDSACFSDEQEFENAKKMNLRLSNCLELKKSFLVYQVHAKFLKREHFKLSEHDFLIKVNIVNGDFQTDKENNGVTPDKRDITKDYISVQFVTFQISKNIYSQYKVRLNNEFFRLNFMKFGENKTKSTGLNVGSDYTNQDGVINVLLDDKKFIKVLTIDRKYSQANDFYIYDDITYSLVKKNQQDIWMILESKDANNYILHYPKILLHVDKTQSKQIIDVKNIKPLSWRIDNPYFGKVSGANLKPQMLDWLYALPKIDSDETHFIFYIIPEEKMVDKNGKKIESLIEVNKNMVIYSKRVLVLDDVVSYTIKKLDFTPPISKF